MSKLHQISVSLTQGQKEKLARAYRNKEGVSIRLKHSALRATCSNGHLYLCKIEKIDFLKICQEEGFY